LVREVAGDSSCYTCDQSASCGAAVPAFGCAAFPSRRAASGYHLKGRHPYNGVAATRLIGRCGGIDEVPGRVGPHFSTLERCAPLYTTARQS
jgi:hypothetical protein